MSSWSSHGISRITPIQSCLSTDCWRKILRQVSHDNRSIYAMSMPTLTSHSCSLNVGGWIHFKCNGLESSDSSLGHDMLQSIALDVHWTTHDPEQLTRYLALTNISKVHSLEAHALLLGLKAVLSRLDREHPLIFSPKDMDRYLHMASLGASSAMSLCRIHDRMTDTSICHGVSESLEV